MDGMIIRNIEELPTGVPLEQPLHPKRRRVWTPVASTSAAGLAATPVPSPPIITPVASTSAASLAATPVPSPPIITPRPTPVASTSALETASPVPSQSVASHFVGSPCQSPSHAMFVECSGSTPSTPQRPPIHRPLPRNPMCDEAIFRALNYGSESDSDDDDQDDNVVNIPAFSRIFEVNQDTPEDEVVDVPIAPVSPTLPDDQLIAHEPRSLYDFRWTNFPDSSIPPELRREKFSNSDVGTTVPLADPYEAFIAIWDRPIMEHIVSETNRYAQVLAQLMFEDGSLRPTSRICGWRDTTVDELYTFFAILLSMGVLIKSKIEEYWSTNRDIFYTPAFSTHMALRRFQLLCRCIHFNNNEAMGALDLDPSEAKLFKIQPLLDHLNAKFQALYNLHQNIALDESLLQWKGWLNINQFIPNKAAAVGIKTYELCDSQTGYLWRFNVHTFKKTRLPQQQLDPLTSSTSTIVLKLIDGLEYKGHTLWMDNFYNSPALARRLKSVGFDCVGTLRTNRQFVQESLTKLTKSNMSPGQITGCTSGDVDLMVWRDQNRVATISTYHGTGVSTIDGVTKPILIHDYNVMMGGVDKKDQMLAMYPIERKRTRVWYKKFFRRLLNVSVLNSYILLKDSCPTYDHRAFRKCLISSLLLKHSSPAPIPPAASNNRHFEAKHHQLREYPFLAGQKARQRRMCTQCRKRVHLYCLGCSKPMCMFPCFGILHE